MSAVSSGRPERAPVVAKRLRDLAELPVTELKGVGPERAKALAQIEITSILDLITHYPRRHIDKTKQSSIRDLRLDESAWVFGRTSSHRRFFIGPDDQTTSPFSPNMSIWVTRFRRCASCRHDIQRRGRSFGDTHGSRCVRVYGQPRPE